MLEQSEFIFLTQIFLCLAGGILTRFSLSYANQRWAQTYHNTISYILLPFIAFVITKVISNNIALSLGMVGALSIVRFRNPVKNPLELVIYFKLITLGIALSVSIKWGIALMIFSNFIIMLSGTLRKFFNLNFFKMSFSEGDENNIVEVTAKKELDFSDFKQNISESYIDKDLNEYYYRFIFYEKQKAIDFVNLFKSDEKIKSLKSIHV